MPIKPYFTFYMFHASHLSLSLSLSIFQNPNLHLGPESSIPLLDLETIYGERESMVLKSDQIVSLKPHSAVKDENFDEPVGGEIDI